MNTLWRTVLGVSLLTGAGALPAVAPVAESFDHNDVLPESVSNIPVTEGLNAGASYSVLQLVVQNNEVEWAGGATRIAKNLGVAHRR